MRNGQNRLKMLYRAGISGMLLVALATTMAAQERKAKFRVVVLAEAASIHKPFVDAAKVWLGKEAAELNFEVEYIQNTNAIDEAYLAQHELFIQLDYPPYGWTPKAEQAFKKYIEEGRGGWIGFHHASLLGEFDGYAMWPWFSQFMGGIRFTDYIATFATAEVKVEDSEHPAMKGVDRSFVVEQEEWYTWDRSPRPNVHVLATVNESTYSPETKKKMGGDHPVIWCNEHVKARNIYIFMGHHPELFENADFTRIFRNSVVWAAGR